MNHLQKLLEIMAQLRDPKTGCPWDQKQSFATIAPYTIEEAYEVADAIEQGDMRALCEELGDLLFQVVFHSQMASEAGHFSFDDVAEAISTKMIRRHPHVFGQPVGRDADAQTVAWEDQKNAERAAKGENSVLDGVARALPASTRALKLQNRAARVGFDWDNPRDVLAKISEEIAEVTAEIDAHAPHDRIEDEIGDVLFACINLARKLKVDPDQALKRTNTKFESRFRYIEKRLAEQGRKPENASLDEMEALWIEAKGK